MAPLDLKTIIPHADARDLAFLRPLLLLDPKRRTTAQQALCSPYFATAPLPCSNCQLPTGERGRGELRRGDVKAEDVVTMLAALVK